MPVLVADGDDAAIKILRTLLQQLKVVEIDDANNLADCLTKMRAKRYGFVVAEWQTEPMTARDFLADVRADPALARIPIIMTGEAKAVNVIIAKRAGANSYIVKPFNAQTLKAKIDAAFLTRTSVLPERRQPAASPQSPDASATTPSAADRTKFDGVFTSSLD